MPNGRCSGPSTRSTSCSPAWGMTTSVTAGEMSPTSSAGCGATCRPGPAGAGAGSPTPLPAILARSLGIPAVARVAHVTSLVKPGDTVLVDGSAGSVLVNPGTTAAEAAMARHRATVAPARPDL